MSGSLGSTNSLRSERAFWERVSWSREWQLDAVMARNTMYKTRHGVGAVHAKGQWLPRRKKRTIEVIAQKLKAMEALMKPSRGE